MSNSITFFKGALGALFLLFLSGNVASAQCGGNLYTNSGTGGFINSVQIDSYTNTSGHAVGNLAPQDFTGTPISVTAGQSYTAVIEVGNSFSPSFNTSGAMWVDWNGDLVWDASENVFLSPLQTPQVYTFSLMVPSGTTAGNKRVRVRAAEGTMMSASDACTVLSAWGEVEDYMLNVGSPCPMVTALSTGQRTTNSLNIYWTAVAGISQYKIGYRVLGATTWTYTAPFTPNIVTGQPTQRFRTLSGLQSGTTYEIVVQASGAGLFSCMDSNILTDYTNGVTTGTCRVPTGVYVENSTIYFTPQQGNVCTIISYGLTSISPTQWTTVTAPNNSLPLQLSPGNYGFRLRANCVNCNLTSNSLSSYSQIFYFTVGALPPREGAPTISETANLSPSLSLYPNPNKGAFTLNVENFNTRTVPVQILDMTGRTVLSQTISTRGETAFDLTSYAKGIYLVKVGEKTAKIIVE